MPVKIVENNGDQSEDDYEIVERKAGNVIVKNVRTGKRFPVYHDRIVVDTKEDDMPDVKKALVSKAPSTPKAAGTPVVPVMPKAVSKPPLPKQDPISLPAGEKWAKKQILESIIVLTDSHEYICNLYDGRLGKKGKVNSLPVKKSKEIRREELKVKGYKLI